MEVDGIKYDLVIYLDPLNNPAPKYLSTRCKLVRVEPDGSVTVRYKYFIGCADENSYSDELLL